MKPRVVGLTFALWFGLLSVLPAQQIFLAEYKGRMLPVVQAHKNTALVMNGDQLATVEGSTYAFHEGGDFLPFFVAVTKLEASTGGMEFVDGGGPLNNEFHLHATFASAYEIPDVYLVLQLELEGGLRSIFVQEIGDLHAGQPHRMNLTLPLSHDLGEGHYVLHLYSGGVELLSSRQPPAVREHALDNIVAKRAAGQPDGPPQLLIGPAPDYPPALLKTHPAGNAMVRCKVHRNGKVSDAVVASATEPAFGEAALAAVRQWRFIPRIKNGEPVDTAVILPLNFSPDKKS